MTRTKFVEISKKIGYTIAIKLLNILHEPNEKSITFNGVLYMEIITAYPGVYTASDLADMLCVARSAVAQKVNELEKLNYLRKKQSNTDKRVYYLYPTGEFADKLIGLSGSLYEKLSDKYSATDIDNFCEMIDFITEELAWHKNKDNKTQ